ncbi:hypothetical protein ACFW5X_19575 [Streptomyces albogriseolus]|nr:hypothetical protein [Streptomyces sp. CL7]WPP33253.1 hypothetical protein SJH97_29700 [Streptomyces sp. CL7]
MCPAAAAPTRPVSPAEPVADGRAHWPDYFLNGAHPPFVLPA